MNSGVKFQVTYFAKLPPVLPLLSLPSAHLLETIRDGSKSSTDGGIAAVRRVFRGSETIMFAERTGKSKWKKPAIGEEPLSSRELPDAMQLHLHPYFAQG